MTPPLGILGAHQYVSVDACLGNSIDLARKLGTDIPDADIRARFKSLARVHS
jgi:hypothetical protein